MSIRLTISLSSYLAQSLAASAGLRCHGSGVSGWRLLHESAGRSSFLFSNHSPTDIDPPSPSCRRRCPLGRRLSTVVGSVDPEASVLVGVLSVLAVNSSDTRGGSSVGISSSSSFLGFRASSLLPFFQGSYWFPCGEFLKKASTAVVEAGGKASEAVAAGGTSRSKVDASDLGVELRQRNRNIGPLPFPLGTRREFLEVDDGVWSSERRNDSSPMTPLTKFDT